MLNLHCPFRQAQHVINISNAISWPFQQQKVHALHPPNLSESASPRLPTNMYALNLIVISVCFSMKATTIRAQTCYYPDGSVSHRDTPCRVLPYGQASPCCGATDICLDNDYCLAQSGPEVVTRGSCTDSSWQSGECPQYCQDGQFSTTACEKHLPLPLWVARKPSVLTLLSSSLYLDECIDILSQYCQYVLLWNTCVARLM